MNDSLTKNHKKAVSLPKLRSNTQKNQSPTKPFQQLHKVKWSISPKCPIPGHEGKQVLYICINSSCQQSTRLVCETCFFKNHEKHNQEFLAVDQVKRGNIEKLRYWPFNTKYRKIFEFITQHESYINNMVQDVNATFNNMAMRILNSIDKIRLKLLRKIDTFYVKETTKKKFTNKITEDLQNCFEIKKIQEIVRKLFSKEIRHDIFLEQMKNVLNDHEIQQKRQALLKYFDQTEKGSDMFFDKMHFMKKQNWIIEQIQEQKKALKEKTVTIDEAEVGIQNIVIKTIDYLNRNSSGQLPLTYNIQELEDGSIYQGFLYHNSKTLFGMRTYKNGFVYYGEWKHNAKNGWGVYQNKSTGYRYAGQWKQDRKWGFGRQNTLKWTFEGIFIADRRQGLGVYMEDGVRLQVTWKNDKKHGQGKIIQKNGEQQDIYYLNGIQSKGKVGKSIPAFDLKQLSKRFGSVKSVSEQ